MQHRHCEHLTARFVSAFRQCSGALDQVCHSQQGTLRVLLTRIMEQQTTNNRQQKTKDLEHPIGQSRFTRLMNCLRSQIAKRCCHTFKNFKMPPKKGSPSKTGGVLPGSALLIKRNTTRRHIDARTIAGRDDQSKLALAMAILYCDLIKLLVATSQSPLLAVQFKADDEQYSFTGSLLRRS